MKIPFYEDIEASDEYDKQFCLNNGANIGGGREVELVEEDNGSKLIKKTSAWSGQIFRKKWNKGKCEAKL